jgi:hypothetical protein
MTQPAFDPESDDLASAAMILLDKLAKRDARAAKEVMDRVRQQAPYSLDIPEQATGPIVRQRTRGEPATSPAPTSTAQGSRAERVAREVVDRMSLIDVPHDERTRRALLLGLGVAFIGLAVMQVSLALVVSSDQWDRVGPLLTTLSTVAAGLIGAATGYYFTPRGTEGRASN